MPPQYSPGLTAVVMVRDDAERLDRCLTSLAPVVNQIIVLDTGSKDDSVKVAQQHAYRVLETPWPEAFDEALNILLDAVETEWTIRLDSDEWLEEDQLHKFQTLMSRQDAFLARLIMRNFNREGGFADMHIERIWRTHPEMRYRGVIHEQFWPDIRAAASEGRHMVDTDILVLHDGYAEGNREEKLRRNLRLVQKELELRPGNFYYEVVLADTLGELFEPGAEEVIDGLIQRCLRTMQPPQDLLIAIVFGKVMVTMPDEALRQPRTAKMIAYVQQYFTDLPPLMYAVAHLEARRGNPRKALDAALQVERLRNSGQFNHSISVRPEVFWANLELIAEVASSAGQPELVSQVEAILASASEPE